MKYQRQEREHSVLANRQKMWDYFDFYYFNQPHRLYKNHGLTDGCAMCRLAAYQQMMEHRRQRKLARQIIAEQLSDYEDNLEWEQE